MKILSLYLLCSLLTICCPLLDAYAADDILEKGIVEFKSENYEEALSFFQTDKTGQPFLFHRIFLFGPCL